MNDVASGTANAATVSCLALNLYVGVARRLMGGGVTVTGRAWVTRLQHYADAASPPPAAPTNVSILQGNRLPYSARL